MGSLKFLTAAILILSVGATPVTSVRDHAIRNLPNTTSDGNRLSPAALGCTSSSVLSRRCLCANASAPLDCYSEGPSDNNDCWYQLEDWFSDACFGEVPAIIPSTMPKCIQSCMFGFLTNAGCATHSRNCFCVLDRQAIIDGATACMSKGCYSHMKPAWDPAIWHDNICTIGQTEDFDQEAYDNYPGWVRKVHVSVTTAIGFLAFTIIITGLGFCALDAPGAGFAAILVAIIVLIAVMTDVPGH